ncbi:MAG TPA: hypothetical protein VGM83_22065 [Devosiaceae bacterium]
MVERVKVVAVLAANPALASILTMVLASAPTLRVRNFDNEATLVAYMRLAPVDLLVVDFDREEAPADLVAHAVRHDTTLVRRDFSIIALTRTVTDTTKRAAIVAGIDEVIVKPMSPRYLLERVQSLLKRQEAAITERGLYHGPDRRGRLPFGKFPVLAFSRSTDKVVPL